jgi:hypothetical protein
MLRSELARVSKHAVRFNAHPLKRHVTAPAQIS